MAKLVAEELAKKQKEISVSEFFERNKHILGFDSSTRALITSVKEAIDNGLDACEEAGILPDLYIEIRKESADEVTMIVEDNGPGIVKQQIGNIFGRLLYGSRFHAIRQSRGQQGIGISATVMYGQLTTGKPAIIRSKIGKGQPVILTHLKLDTRNNKPDVVKQEPLFGEWEDKESGTRIEVTMSAKYQRGPQSVFEYLRSTAIVNPHAKLTFKEPDGTTTVFDRVTEKLPDPTKEIKPHPEGIELGMLLKMAKHTTSKTLSSFLQDEFSRISADKAREIAEAAGLKPLSKMSQFDLPEAKALMAAFKKVKLMAPPVDCLSPIGEVLIRKGLKKELPETEFIATVTRPPTVFAGRPVIVEAGLAYGGGLPKDEQVRIVRFANRVPLLYQKGACVSTNGVEGIDWRRYELEQRGGKGIPIGPVVVLVHVASVNVPFTSEAKEAIADIDVLRNEIQLALRECGRKLGSHVRKKAKLAKMRQKENIIRKIIPRLAEKSAGILNRPVPDYEPVIARIMNNMMIDDVIEYDEKKKQHKVNITITNYCNFGKSFELFAVAPHNVPVVHVDPEPIQVEEGLIRWKVKRIPTTEKAHLTFTLEGLDQSDFDENELFVKGIDADLVIGAEQWKGKEDVAQIERENVRTISLDGTETEGIVEPSAAEEDEDDLDASAPTGKGGVELALKDDGTRQKAAKPKKKTASARSGGAKSTSKKTTKKGGRK